MTIPSTPIPARDPDSAIPQITDPAPVVITGHAARSIAELLERCDQFWRTHPMLRDPLQAFLDAGPEPYAADLFVDLLGFNALHLQAKIATATTSIEAEVQADAEPGNIAGGRS